VWVTTCGFSESNLYFLLGGSHPMPSGAQRTMLETTMPEAIADIVADPAYRARVSGIDGFKIRVPDHLLATWSSTSHSEADEDSNDTYVMARTERDYRSDDSGGSPVLGPAHLNERGYIDWGMRLVGTLVSEAFASGLVGASASTAYRNR
jgi:hypothetical protein